MLFPQRGWARAWAVFLPSVMIPPADPGADQRGSNTGGNVAPA